MSNIAIQTASVKVMRSHDYCHFEVCLSSSEADTPQKVDELRKEAARLADKAVTQYRAAKASQERRDRLNESWRLKDANETPENERTPTQKAVIKYHADASFAARFDYDYEDDYDPQYNDEEI